MNGATMWELKSLMKVANLYTTWGALMYGVEQMIDFNVNPSMFFYS